MTKENFKERYERVKNSPEVKKSQRMARIGAVTVILFGALADIYFGVSRWITIPAGLLAFSIIVIVLDKKSAKNSD